MDVDALLTKITIAFVWSNQNVKAAARALEKTHTEQCLVGYRRQLSGLKAMVAERAKDAEKVSTTLSSVWRRCVGWR